MTTKMYDLVLIQFGKRVPFIESAELLDVLMEVVNDLCDEEYSK
jgi:hypothetical protein